jgi:hypothetical protein
MYNDYFFLKKCLGLWISYTLTNKKTNSITYKHITKKKKKNYNKVKNKSKTKKIFSKKKQTKETKTKEIFYKKKH